METNLKYPYYLVYFELLYRDVPNLEILSHEDLDFGKIRTKKTVLPLSRQYNKRWL